MPDRSGTPHPAIVVLPAHPDCVPARACGHRHLLVHRPTSSRMHQSAGRHRTCIAARISADPAYPPCRCGRSSRSRTATRRPPRHIRERHLASTSIRPRRDLPSQSLRQPVPHRHDDPYTHSSTDCHAARIPHRPAPAARADSRPRADTACPAPHRSATRLRPRAACTCRCRGTAAASERCRGCAAHRHPN